MNARTFDDPTAPPTWLDAQDGTLHCLQVREETHDVKTFVFAGSSPRSYRYLPGQFVTLELQIGGETVHRCYTLSSTPTRPDCVSITVKRVPGGPVSNWLHDHLQPGATLRAAGPAGRFSCFMQPAVPRYLFLSGGSGITPLMSMSRALHDLSSDADVVFLHCARTPADLLFAEELALFARNMKRFRVAFVCEQQPPRSAYAGHLGRVDLAKLQQAAPDFRERDVYTCGPAPFMSAVRQLLAAAGYAMSRYREESFCFDTLDAPAGIGDSLSVENQPAARPTEFQITLEKSGRSFPCRTDQPILQAASAAGIRLPFSCSNGMCGTCKSKKASGHVEMQHNGGIRQREIDQGWVLPCCSRPLTDVTLER